MLPKCKVVSRVADPDPVMLDPDLTKLKFFENLRLFLRALDPLITITQMQGRLQGCRSGSGSDQIKTVLKNISYGPSIQ